MSITNFISRLREIFSERGEFALLPNESVNAKVIRAEVSNGYGVYVISGIEGTSRRIVYVGKAGTILQDGTVKEQGLRKRLIKKQGGLLRKVIF